MTTDRKIFKEFLNPGAAYTPIPFWFWNDQLDKKLLRQQIEDFQEKGVEGFVLHPRLGIPKDIEYLSDTFMEFVAFAVKEAHQRKMRVMLYDEAMYPSGAANGKVVELNPRFASRGLHATVYEEVKFPFSIRLEEDERIVAIFVLDQKEKEYDPGNILCIYPEQNNDSYTLLNKQHGIQIESSEHHLMKNKQIIVLSEDYTNGTIRGIHYGQDDGEKYAPRSADLLNPEAVKAFIQLTHERYKEVVGEYFGNTIVAMFTDEPDITGRNSKPGYLAWTEGFEHELLNQGYRYNDLLSLFFDSANAEQVRQDYDRAINERMLASYYIPISEWCLENNLDLTGHPEKSDDIGLLKAFHIPGQDVVWRWVAPENDKGITGPHSTAGKCGADAARHFGRRRNMNEYLGVCGKENTWNLSAADMKWYTDWLAVRGVNLFCPHAFYYSIDGVERSHERPPDVGPNNVWWPYYRLFSNYMKRLSWLMTDSVNEAKIGILTLNNQLPWKMARYFFENQMEFNYVHEDLFLLNKVKVIGNILKIEQQQYEVIILDDMQLEQFNPRVATVLYNFISQGGKVYVISSTLPTKQFKQIHYLSYDQLEKMGIFSRFQHIQLESRSSNIRVSKVWKGKQYFYFIVNEGEEPFSGNIQFSKDIPTEAWDAWTGKRHSLEFSENKTYLHLGYRESIILTSTKNEKAPLRLDDSTKEVHTMEVQLVPSRKDGYWQYSRLQDWQETDELTYYSGAINYLLHFQWQEKKADMVVLDLGSVYEIAEVHINNQLVGVKMWAPYEFSIPKQYLRDGENEIVVRITNNSAVAMDHQPQPSGLIGPVKVKVIAQEGDLSHEENISSE